MIYQDVLNEKTKIIRPIVERFVNHAIQNQTHSGDSLLILLNGHYNPTIPKSCYLYGTDWSDVATETFDNYIKWYLNNANQGLN